MFNKLRETISQKQPEILLGGLLGTLLYFGQIVLTEVILPVFHTVLPELSKKGLASLIGAQLFVIVIGSIYILASRGVKRHYRFDKRLGIHFHKKTNEPFCPSCLASDIESPLREKESDWRCQRKDCASKYINPDYKSPEPPPEPQRNRSNWVKGY